MISDYRCFYCFVKAFGKLLDKSAIPAADKEQFTIDMLALYQQERSDFSAPHFSKRLHQKLAEYTLCNDPYMNEKQESNDKALALYGPCRQMVLEAADPFDKALRLAIAGNIIDYAVHDQYDIEQSIQNVLNGHFAIDHSPELKKELKSAASVLYLGDNAGEIVFDKLFIETLMHPGLTYTVRATPIINDATFGDAEYVGMTDVAEVITTGDGIPSVSLSTCSEEFKSAFEQADLVISKGQGNLEGLLGKTNKNIYFLLMVKCNVIAEILQVRKGDFVVFKEKP